MVHKFLTISALLLTLLLTGCYEEYPQMGVRVYHNGSFSLYRVYNTDDTEICMIMVYEGILEHNCFSDEEARRIIND